jgi:ribosomal protein L37AE/L43A
MFIDILASSKQAKLNQLLHTLKHVHGFVFEDFETHNLQQLQEQYAEEIVRIESVSRFNSYHAMPEYAKAALITEAARLLIEIAPKRKKTTTNQSSRLQESSMQYKKGDRVLYKGKECEVVKFTRGPMLGLSIDGKVDMVKKSEVKPCKIVESTLMEEEDSVDKATIIVAASGISDKLQSMAEEAARLAVDKLMSLVNDMKKQFGPEAAEAFNDVVKSELHGVLDKITDAKDQTDNAIIALQGGEIPSGKSDMEKPLPSKEPAAEPSAEKGEDFDWDKAFSAEPAASGPEKEPLGRERKEVAESMDEDQICRECGEGVYEETPGGHMQCSDCGHEIIGEKWDADMHTAKKDVGKWDDWTIAELRDRKKKLMDKPKRTAAEQKEVRQLVFAIRAKQKDQWGEIDESKGAFDPRDHFSHGMLAARKELRTGEKAASVHKPGTAAHKSWSKGYHSVMKHSDDYMEEAKKQINPYAIGMAQAKREAGLSDKPAHDLPKKVIVRAHEIARNIEAKESEVNKLKAINETLLRKISVLKKAFNEHKQQFQAQLQETASPAHLAMGHGIEGAAVIQKLRATKLKLDENKKLIQENVKAITEMKQYIRVVKTRISKLNEQQSKTPFGLIALSTNGNKIKKFFESDDNRSRWVEYHKENLSEVTMIEPEDLEKIKNRLKNTI